MCWASLAQILKQVPTAEMQTVSWELPTPLALGCLLLSQPLPQRSNSKTGPVMMSHLDGWAEPEPAGVHIPRHQGEQKRTIHRQNRVLFSQPKSLILANCGPAL